MMKIYMALCSYHCVCESLRTNDCKHARFKHSGKVCFYIWIAQALINLYSPFTTSLNLEIVWNSKVMKKISFKIRIKNNHEHLIILSVCTSIKSSFVCCIYVLHNGGDMVLRSSYFHIGNYCNDKMSSLNRIRPGNCCEHQIYKLHKHAMKHSYIPVDMQIASLHIIHPCAKVMALFFRTWISMS